MGEGWAFQTFILVTLLGDSDSYRMGSRLGAFLGISLGICSGEL